MIESINTYVGIINTIVGIVGICVGLLGIIKVNKIISFSNTVTGNNNSNIQQAKTIYNGTPCSFVEGELDCNENKSWTGSVQGKIIAVKTIDKATGEAVVCDESYSKAMDSVTVTIGNNMDLIIKIVVYYN